MQGTKEPILVWEFHDAPAELKALSHHGGDEDYVALIPAVYSKDDYIRWLEEGHFANDCQELTLPDGRRVIIGAHT